MQEQYIHIDEYGNKIVYKDREMKICHRLDGQAVEHADGGKEWWQDGKRHRTDGPAVEYADGSKLWYGEGHHQHTIVYFHQHIQLLGHQDDEGHH